MPVQIAPSAGWQDERPDRQGVSGWQPREDALIRDAEGRADDVGGGYALCEAGLGEELGGGDDGDERDLLEEGEARWGGRRGDAGDCTGRLVRCQGGRAVGCGGCVVELGWGGMFRLLFEDVHGTVRVPLCERERG